MRDVNLRGVNDPFTLNFPGNVLTENGRIWPEGKAEPNFDRRLSLPPNVDQCAHVEWSNKDGNFRRCLKSADDSRANGYLCSAHQHKLIDEPSATKGNPRNKEQEVVDFILRGEGIEIALALGHGIITQHAKPSNGRGVITIDYPESHPARRMLVVEVADADLVDLREALEV